jgi:hypothetical protein
MVDRPREVEERNLLRERRLNMRLMAYWWDKRGERRFPMLEEFDPAALSDIWASCFTLMPSDPLAGSRFDYIGEAIAETSRVGTTTRTLADLPGETLLEHATRAMDDVLEQKVPVIASGEFTVDGTATAVFRSILLPTSTDQTDIDHVIGGARCKVLKAS